jgi:heme/copper-type cytochrome/quinol oxidase subunit 2
MTGDNSAKADEATAPQSPIVRHLGLIKAMSVIMAILIVAALVVIVVTIYSRLTAMENSAEPRQSRITLPAGARVSSASISDKGQMLLLVDHENRQHLWQFDRAGRLQQQIEIRASTP